MELHAGDALEAGQVQIDGPGPLAKGQRRLLHDGARLYAEIRPAIGTPIRHLCMTGLARPRTPATRTVATARPDTRLEPFPRRVIRPEHIREMHHRDAFAVRLSGGFCSHRANSLPIQVP